MKLLLVQVRTLHNLVLLFSLPLVLPLFVLKSDDDRYEWYPQPSNFYYYPA